MMILLAASHVPTPAHEGITTGATVLGLNAEGWVYVSLTIFLVTIIWFGRAHHRVRDALDAKIAETRRELDEARKLREDAEKLLADAKAKHAASAGDAAAIVAHAEDEAKDMLAKAEHDAAELVERRGKMAEDKIATAERQALLDVRARAADAAAEAAGTLIGAYHGPDADKAMVDRAIAGLNR